MKALLIDPAKLLGFRLGMTEQTKNGTVATSAKIGDKVGGKPIDV